MSTPRYRLKRQGSRRKMNAFELNEISCVDFPAQVGATMTIMKRREPAVEFGKAMADGLLKYYGEVAASGMDYKPRAQRFADLLQRELENRRASEREREVWPITDALFSSIRSIVGDDQLQAEEKQKAVQESVDDFMAVMREKWPSVEQAVADALGKACVMPAEDEDDDKPKTKSARMATLKARVAMLDVDVSGLITKAGEFDESKHPRDDGGKFDGGGGAGSASLSPQMQRAVVMYGSAVNITADSSNQDLKAAGAALAQGKGSIKDVKTLARWAGLGKDKVSVIERGFRSV